MTEIFLEDVTFELSLDFMQDFEKQMEEWKKSIPGSKTNKQNHYAKMGVKKTMTHFEIVQDIWRARHMWGSGGQWSCKDC